MTTEAHSGTSTLAGADQVSIRTRDVDLFVLGTHGHGFVSHVLMGSTAERILHHAPCPVLVVPAETS